jgi:hypothetical protein
MTPEERTAYAESQGVSVDMLDGIVGYGGPRPAMQGPARKELPRHTQPMDEAMSADMAELAAVVDRREVSPQDAAMAKVGKQPRSLKDMVSQYREELGSRHLVDVVDPERPEASREFLRTQMTDDKEALKAGAKERIRTLPISDEEQAILEVEAVYMEQRQLIAQMEQFAQAQEKAFLELGRMGDDEVVEFAGIPVSALNDDVVPQLGLEFTPRTMWDAKHKIDGAIEAGLLPDNAWTKFWGYFGMHGATMEEATEAYDKLPDSKKIEALEAYTNYLKEVAPDWFPRTNLNLYFGLTDLVDEAYIEGAGVENKLKRRMLNLVGWLGGLEVVTAGVATLGTAPVKAAIRVALKAPVVTRMGLMQKPTLWAESMRRAFNDMPDSAVATYFNTDKIEIAQSQLPGPKTGEPLVNVPDGVLTPREVDRLEQTTAAAQDTHRRLGSNTYTAREQGQIINQVVGEIEASHGGHMRLGASEISLRDDMSGVDMDIILGADKAHGFKSAQEAAEYAEQIGLSHADGEYLRVRPDGTYEQVKPTLTRNEAGEIEVTGAKPGEYVLRAKYQHTFGPEDTRLFDGTPVVLGAWQGRALGWLSTPSSFLQGTALGKFTRSYLREQALTNQLDAIIAPLFKMPTKSRLRVNDAMEWAEEFGVTHGKMPTVKELKKQFPKMSEDEVKGFYTARHFQDTLWGMQNDRLHRNWKARGFVTATNGDGPVYHGAPVDEAHLRSKAVRSYYDPTTGKSVALNKKALAEYLEGGGKVIRMELPMQGSKGQSHHYVLVDAQKGFRTQALRKNVLEYIPGYNTRIYEDAHFVQRVKTNSNIDGMNQTHTSTMRTASSKKQAKIFQMRVMDALGRKLYKDEWDKSWGRWKKHDMLKEKGYEIKVSRDQRLSDSDRVQIDLEKMQVEGRLFFDNRQKRAIRNTDNQVADVVDPINAMQRTARMAARQVATEDLVAAQKNQFFLAFKDKLEINGKKTSAEIDTDLTKIIKKGSAEEKKLATKARGWWRYIRFMEGSMNADPGFFRATSINLGEWVDDNIGRKIGGRAFTKELAKSMGRADAVRAAKSLAFLHFITARPVRQLLLQGLQHYNLAAIDPKYGFSGKWQMDTFSLLSAMKRLSRAREDANIIGLKRKQMSGMLGYDELELEVLMREFQASGLVDTVNVHSYAGGTTKEGKVTRNTVGGRAVAATSDTATSAANRVRAIGFDLGEQFNVTASYLMALRRTMKDKGYKKLTQLDQDEWDQIANRGSQYALSMHKANAAQWQYGLVSLPMQFLQFSHKWLLTALGTSKTMRKAGLANQQFTQEEAWRIMIAQGILWGGAGMGVKPLMENWINSYDPTGSKLTQDQRNLITGGLTDWGVNEILQNTLKDPELSFAIDETFAPAAGFEMTWEKIMEVATEPMMFYEPLLGPAGEVATRYGKAVAFGQAVTGQGFAHWDTRTRTQAVIEAAAAGLFSQYSDILKVRLANKMGQWTNQAGMPTGLEATWEELVVKGTLGVNPDKLLNYYDYVGNLGDLKRTIKEDAREHANRLNYIVNQWSNAGAEKGYMDAMAAINTMAMVFELYKEDGLGNEYYKALLSEIKRVTTPETGSVARNAAELVMGGYTGDVFADLLNSGILTPEQHADLTQAFERAQQTQDINDHERERLFELERETVRSLTDGK